jgi:hypothetical protein
MKRAKIGDINGHRFVPSRRFAAQETLDSPRQQFPDHSEPSRTSHDAKTWANAGIFREPRRRPGRVAKRHWPIHKRFR